eukprot:4809225-Amphidinium_carterae.1
MASISGDGVAACPTARCACWSCRSMLKAIENPNKFGTLSFENFIQGGSTLQEISSGPPTTKAEALMAHQQ